MSTHDSHTAHLHNMPNRAPTVTHLKVAIVALLTLPMMSLPSLLAQEGSLSPETQSIDASSLAGHIRFLADDLLEGRGPGTRGDQLTQLYLSSQFQRIGLLPGAENHQWFQSVPLVGITTQQPASLTFRSERETLELKQHDDFIAVGGVETEHIQIPPSEVVFVGYGITAPEYAWDDYANVDVRGKIVMVMNNDPEDDPDLFGGRRRLYYGRWDYKYANAAAHGAVGAIIIHTEASAGYPYSVVQTSWSGEESELKGDDAPRLRMKSWVTEESARRIAKLASQDLETLRASANRRGFRSVPLDIKTETQFTCTISSMETANVLAVLPGSDPKFADEYVILMAHHDHLGVAKERNEKSDPIYNGAIDNASGTAALLSIAEAFASAEQAPRRSLLFAAVAAEEQGLLGSKYYAAHSTIAPGKIAGLVNMDSMNFLGRSVDIQVVGYGKSSIDSIVTEVAALQARSVVPDQFIDRGYFYRSDQFSLAKIGVPGLYLHAGTTIRDKPENWGRDQQEAWTKQTYHQPSDEYDPNWNLVGMVEDSQLLMEVTKRMANADAIQMWNPGDEFEAARKASLVQP